MTDNIRILVVEDDENLAETFCELVSEAGYICDVTTTLDDALLSLQRKKYDVILMDYRIGTDDCSSLVLHMAANFKAEQWGKIILVSGTIDKENFQEIQKYISRALMKPVAIDDLLATIEDVLHA